MRMCSWRWQYRECLFPCAGDNGGVVDIWWSNELAQLILAFKVYSLIHISLPWCLPRACSGLHLDVRNINILHTGTRNCPEHVNHLISIGRWVWFLPLSGCSSSGHTESLTLTSVLIFPTNQFLNPLLKFRGKILRLSQPVNLVMVSLSVSNPLLSS